MLATNTTLQTDAQILTETDVRLRRRVGNLARFVEFECSGGVLTLHGKLPSWHAKQVIQHCLIGIDGVTQIRNETIVE